MIHIIENTPNQAWRKTLVGLYEKGEETGNERYLRDEVALIEIAEPTLEPADHLFPMAQRDIDIINNFIVSGEDEEKVNHEWTKLYYHRIFDTPNSQIDFLISKLNADKPAGDAQISIWDKLVDQKQQITPCTQIIWARIKRGKLELHVHANSSDAYKKLLMNILEFVSLHHYIADKVGLPVGKYYHFLDSCHLHKKDSELITELLQKLS